MGSVTDFLLGSDPSVDTVSTTTQTPEQQDVLRRLSELVGSNIGVAGPVYEGQMAAGASAIQQRAFDSIDQFMQGGINTGNQVTTQGPTTVPMIQSPNADMGAVRDQWQRQFMDPAQQQFDQQIAPNIMQKFAGMNASDSSALNREMGRAGADMNVELQGILANMMGNERTQNNQMQFAADTTNTGRQIASNESFANRDLNAQGMELDRLFQVPGLQSTLANLGLTAGGQQQQIEQGQLDEMLRRWQMGQVENNPIVNNYLSSVLGTQGIQVDTIANQGGTGLLSGLMGGLGRGFGQGVGEGVGDWISS